MNKHKQDLSYAITIMRKECFDDAGVAGYIHCRAFAQLE